MTQLFVAVLAILGGIVGMFGLVFGLSLLFAYPLMWAINYTFAPAVLVAIFGTASVSVWKAFALSVVCGTLFKSSTTVNKA
jgi:hypothetical protein